VYIKRKIDKAPQIYSTGWVTLGQLCNILLIIRILCFIFNLNLEYNSKISVGIISLLIYSINSFFLLTKKKYEKLAEKYKNEKHRKIKGWGVFLYLVGSVFLLVYTGLKPFYVLST
jgi:hypothetical protein